MSGYLPWYAGAAALALVAVGSCIVARRPLGVSGILSRMVNLRAELEADRARAASARLSVAELERALLAATLEAFGPPPPAGWAAAATASAAPALGCGSEVLLPAAALPARGGRACKGTCASPAVRPSVAAHALFLAGIVVGGFVAAVLRGGFHLTLDMGPDFGRLLGTGGRGLAFLALGGFLAGMGVTIAGGCSTGHGLSGCSRLQPASMVATATFLGAAMAVSLLLAGRLA